MKGEILNQINELLKSATEDECKDIMKQLAQLQESKVESFAEKILKKENVKKNRYEVFLESKSVNGLITAPTQVGKTDATRKFIETCFKAGVPVIVSTDNKTDQCEQLYGRIEKDLAGADVKMMKVKDRGFEHQLKECVKTGFHRFVIFCLDNSTQIEKLIANVMSVSARFQEEIQEIKKIAIIHDEADQITKDKDTEQIGEEQAESHKKWLELIDLINKRLGYMDLKRVFVTATPENCMMLYNIESADIMKLRVPSKYVGYKDIEYNELEDDLDVKVILKGEVERVKSQGTFEAILYCIDRKIVDGHEKVLRCLAGELNCVISTYNSNGITAYMHKEMSKTFEGLLKGQSIRYKKSRGLFTMKNMPISEFYTMCKGVGENCVVTIGKDLISRGISYVSEDMDKPLTATTMIYKPGTTMHCVGLCQTIGRITGCAMPTLKRRLYAPKDVIDAYLAYNKNQEQYILEIERVDSGSKLTKDVIDEMVFEKLSRGIDRMKLGLKMKTKELPEPVCLDNDEDRMKQLINTWWRADTMIGKILRFVYDSERGVKEEQLKSFMHDSGSENVNELFSELLRKQRGYSYIFERINKVTKLRQEAKHYIDTLIE